MTITLTDPSSITETSANLAFTGAGASGTIDVQISQRADFQWCVCPIIGGFARASPLALPALNRASNNYVRARTVLADGTKEPWSNIVGFRTAEGTAQDTTPATIMAEPALVVLAEPWLSTYTPRTTAARDGFPIANVSFDGAPAWQPIANAADGAFNFSATFEVGNTPIDTVAVLDTNLPEGATMIIRMADNAADLGTGSFTVFSGPFRASTNMPGRAGYHGLARFPEARKRWLFIYIYSAQRWPQIGHIVFGKNIGTRAMSADKTESSIFLGDFARTRSGMPDFQDGARNRRVEFDVSQLTEAQYETFYSQLFRRQNERALIVPNPKSGPFLHDRILYGRLTPGRVTQTNVNRFNRSFALDSII